MLQYFPDMLRAVITDVMLVLLLCTMAMPKYKSRAVYVVATAVILISNLSANYYFYRSQNYTAVFYVDLSMLIFIGAVLKPLFTDGIMQWCFSYITMLNIYAAIVFLSYSFRRVFPDPDYGIIYIRLILFSVIIFILHRWVSRLYRNVLDYWHIYMLPSVALFVCFLVFFFDGDIKDTLTNNYLPLLALTALGLSVYVAIIHSLKTISGQYAMREENRAIQAEREYLHLAADGMAERLKLMEEASAQNSRTAHDRRHFNNVLLELLEHGQAAEAATLLQSRNQSEPKEGRAYCENPAVNAAVCHYASIAEQYGINADIVLDVPSKLSVNALELSMAVSNLMENAIKACLNMPEGTTPYIRFNCCNAGRLLIEMENPCVRDVKLDQSGNPIASGEGHGIGSRSVAAFANKYDGELMYKAENGIFRVRLIV